MERLLTDIVCSLDPAFPHIKPVAGFDFSFEVFVVNTLCVRLWLDGHSEVSGLFNCGAGTASSFKALAGHVFDALGIAPSIDYIDMPEAIRARYQYVTEAPMDRLRAAGYDRPPTPLAAGVESYVSGFLAAADRYR